MQNCLYPVGELLPHAPPMVLLDEVLGWEQGRVRSSVRIRPGIPFYSEGKGVPSYVGLEYMAQTCGAYAGLEALDSDQQIKLGFLLGTRNFHATQNWFESEVTLIIVAVELIRHEHMGVFDCRISCNDIEIASAQLNVYQPDDTSRFVKPNKDRK